MVYLIRKSMIDEATEYGRCNDVDVAISICPPGFNVYDEDGNVMHTSIVEDKYKFGKKWIEIKTTIENNRVKKYAGLLEEVLTLMNSTEIENSKATNYEKLWNTLKESVESEPMHNKFLNMMKELENEGVKDE